MTIEITIIYSPDSVQLSQSSHIFPDEGGTLGRANSNFWALEDPHKYMSSVHAQIGCEAGQYYLKDMSTNGTFINGATEPVGNGNKILLNDGDRFAISDYEFVAKISAISVSAHPFSMAEESDPFTDSVSENSTAFASQGLFSETNSDDPFYDFNAAPVNNDPFAPATISASAENIMPSLQTETPIDPLALLDKTDASVSDPFSLSGARLDSFPNDNFSQNNHFNQHGFSEPAIAENNSVMNESIEWPTVMPESNLIPDDWDDLGFSSAPPLSIAPQEQVDNALAGDVKYTNPMVTAPEIFSSPQDNRIFDKVNAPVVDVFAQSMEKRSFDENITPVADVFSPSVNVATNDSVFNDAPPVVMNTRSEMEYINIEQQNQHLRNEISELKLKLLSVQQAKDATKVNISADVGVALNVVVDAIGLSKWNLDHAKKVEINETVGLLVRETMQGMMQVLKFRKKIKEEFRINVTTIQSVENNPLKFSANIDDALENMFIKENNAYKAPVEAVKEGFQSIAEHQVAVVAGMQAAFRGMIERFDPNQLEVRFEQYTSSGLLGLGKKTKRWNAYKEYHQGLVENIDNSFQHLFGYDFVQAYEEQMQRLINARVTENIDNESTH